MPQPKTKRDVVDGRVLARALVTLLRESTEMSDAERLAIAEIVTDVVCLSCGRVFQSGKPCPCN